MKPMKLLIFFLLFFQSVLLAQGLFEEAAEGSDENDNNAKQTYQLNGFIRGVYYGGFVPDEDTPETKSAYGEAALQMRVRHFKGDSYFEARFRKGKEFSEEIEEFTLREAYLNLYLGRYDIRIGEQIVAWGRADGVNPTNNITPLNMLTRSPNEDDRRISNFLVRSYYNIHPVRLEAIFIPFYKSSELPVNFGIMNSALPAPEPDYPNENLENSGVAFKADVNLPSSEFSLSYFNGFNIQPGLDCNPIVNPVMFSKAYRMHVIGGDFSTAGFSSLGLRGEIAYKTPYDDYEKYAHVINPELQYVMGIDTETASGFSVILQYSGKYVIDYKELPTIPPPGSELLQQLVMMNRMLASQTEEMTHSVTFRPAWKLLYETLQVEALGMYNFTTEELFIRPKLSYDIDDALKITVGLDSYSGPDGTLFGTIDDHLSSVFVELRSSF
ncbi:hypothetical protein K9N50_02880 [bacterium]|nr:hypothetical protein [bacterium]